MSATPASEQRVHVVCVCHQLKPEPFTSSLEALASRSGVALRGVAVCNNAAHSWRSMPREIEILRGSNKLLDFSGFFEGLDHLLASHPEATNGNVLFVNDTLFTKHAASCILGRVLGIDALLRQLQVPAMAGKLDPYRSICIRSPWSGQSGYITSFCFLLNARALPIMQRLLTDASADGVFSEAALSDEAWGQRMPPVFREYIRAHLVHEGSPYLWPSAGARNANLLHKKACCMYFEGRLSGAIAAEGAMVPINSGPRSRAGVFVHESAARILRSLTGMMG